jgi:gamma-glutamyltranspeptidase/glutathione hydrolase
MVEKDFPQDVKLALENMGYKVINRGVIGRTEVIQLHWKGKKLINIEAIADKRGDDHASAY